MAGGQDLSTSDEIVAEHGRTVRVTAAQLRVLVLLARGATYASIARSLFLSPTTVRSHVEALQRRLGVPNNVSLVLAAVATGLLSVDVWPVELTGVTEFDTSRLMT